MLSLPSICSQVFIHFLIATGCETNGDCSGATDTCSAGQCKCGASDICTSVWGGSRWVDKICSLGQCIDE